MGFSKARTSALHLELLYLGCFIFVLLRFPLRPANYIDMFRYADPAASLLDPMMSDLIFAIANDSSPTENSLPLNMVATGNEKIWTGSRKINDNDTTKLSLDYNASYVSLPRDPTVLGNNLPKALDHSTSFNNSKEVYFGSVAGAFRAFPGRENRENDVCHIFDPHHLSWYMSSIVTILKQETLKESLNTTSVQVKRAEEEKVEEDEELEEFRLLKEDSTLTVVYAAFGSDGDLIGVSGPNIYILNSTYMCLEFGDKSSNNDFKSTMKVDFITFGITTLFFIIFCLSWKHIKNLTCLGLSHGSNTFFLSTSTLDETFLIDHNIYEMLMREAIPVSSGSSGKVYKIKFFELKCAMKVFYSHAIMDFRRESVIVANLDHPNIIKFFCCFRKSFIIMELMDKDLYSFIQEKPSDYELSLEVALDVMLQIAEGMSYLHGEGIAHLDLKSLNIFLKLQGEPHSSNFRIIAKIADFGSARSFDPRHPRGFFLRPMENIGTRSWRAPELFPPRGGFVTKVFGIACKILPKPLDIYGFAIICSELLTKQSPYEQRIVHGVELRAGLRPTLPSDGCPEELIALIEDCWHMNPQSRPEFREICTRLSRLIEVQSHEQTPSLL